MSAPAKAVPVSPTVHGVPIPLLLMTLDLGSGRQDLLPIYSESSPSDLAEKLGQKHKLQKPLVQKLETLIRKKKEAASHFVTSYGNISTVLTTTRPSLTEPTPRKGRSQSELKAFSPPRPSNYGDWMYQRGKQFKGKLRYDQLRSAVSQQSMRKKEKKKPRKSEPTEAILMQKAEATQQKIKNQRSEAMEKEMMECTFKPTINERSQKLDRSSSASLHGAQRFEKLYSESFDKEIRQLDREEAAVKTEFPFRPTVSSLRKNPETQSQMIERLLNSKKNFSEVIEKLKAEIEEEEGSRSASAAGFKPITGRGPTNMQYARKGPVHEHLYSQRGKHEAVVERLRRQEDLCRSPPARLSIPKSDEIANETRHRLIRVLFSQLDQNEDGYIDFASLTFQEVDKRSTLILSPIYGKLQESKGRMDLHEFEKNVEALLLEIGNEEKTYLLRAAASIGKAEEPQSPPALKQSFLSKTSEELATKRNQQLGGDVYARRFAEKLETEERVQLLREAQEKAELNGCTFRPAVNKYKRKR